MPGEWKINLHFLTPAHPWIFGKLLPHNREFFEPNGEFLARKKGFCDLCLLARDGPLSSLTRWAEVAALLILEGKTPHPRECSVMTSDSSPLLGSETEPFSAEPQNPCYAGRNRERIFGSEGLVNA